MLHADQQLIEQIKSGNQDAFSSLIRKHQDYVYSICMGILRNRFEAEEAAQDSFLKFHRSIHKIELKVKLRTFLYKIAYRTSLDYIRKRKNIVSLDNSKHDTPDSTSTEEELMNKDRKVHLMKALSELKPEEAAIMTLFYFKELNINEIIDITGLSKSNIKIKLMRSRNKLKQIIDEKYPSLILEETT